MTDKVVFERVKMKKIFYGAFSFTVVIWIVGSWFFSFFSKHGLIIPLIMIVAVGYFSLSIWMLVDCVSRDFESRNTKKNWIGAIIFFGIFGALAYFIKVKSREVSSDITAGSSE